MIRLTPRLQALADLVTPGTTVADIGTDHAYLPAWLMENGRIPGGWACDVQQGPLDNARETLEEAGLTDRIQLRLGSGLEPLKGERPQCIIMAGMGGLLMIKLLETSYAQAQNAEYLLLQPQNNRGELRRWLITHGFRIVQERLAQEEHRFYEIIRVVPGNGQEPDDLADEIGYLLPVAGDPLFPSFIEMLLRKYEAILKDVARAGAANELQALHRKKIEQLQEVYRCASIREKSSV